MKTKAEKNNRKKGPVSAKEQPPSKENTAVFKDQRSSSVVHCKLGGGMGDPTQQRHIAQLRSAMQSASGASSFPLQRKANRTGLPNNLKSGIENLSGFAMDDVKVHYNSDKPAQLQAHAYAQGSDIHLAPGQEKHLAHEAWHVVQQKQGRVKPTRQLKSKVAINDNAGLEREADVMGAKAMQFKGDLLGGSNLSSKPVSSGVRQLKIFNDTTNNKVHWRVKSQERLKEVLLGKELEGVEQWKVTMVEEFWKLFGGRKSPKAKTNALVKILDEKEKSAKRTFDYFKAGVYITGGTTSDGVSLEGYKEDRMFLKEQYQKANLTAMHPWLEPMVNEMRGNVLAMMDDLIVSFYYNGEADEAIMNSGALISSRQREKAAKGETVESKTPTIDKDLHNDDYVFGFMEHKDMLPKGDSRFAAASTEDGVMNTEKEKLDLRRGMRISRPLRWYLNQPGALVQLGDLIASRPRDRKKGIRPMKLPEFIIGIIENVDGAQLKSYPVEESGEDKATRMMRDLFESIKAKLFAQVSWGNPSVALRDGIFNERASHVHNDYLRNVKAHENNPSVYFDRVIRKYAQAQVLLPERIKHSEGTMTKIKLEDFYDFEDADEDGNFPKPTPKTEATDSGMERRMTNISNDPLVPAWPPA